MTRPTRALAASMIGDAMTILCGATCEDCGSLDCSFQPCPYDLELHGDDTPMWLCDRCAHERHLDT